MALTYTSGIYLHLEGLDSEVTSVQMKRELTWAFDLEALRYLDCSGVPHYIYSSDLDISGILAHVEYINIYGTGLWGYTDYPAYIEPLRSKGVYVSGVQWIGPGLDPSKILPMNFYGDTSSLYMANVDGEPAVIESHSNDGASFFSISRNVYHDTSPVYIADGNDDAIQYLQGVTSSETFHLLRLTNGSTPVSSGDTVTWENEFYMNQVGSYFNYTNKNMTFEARGQDIGEPLVWNLGKFSLGMLPVFKTPPERVSISGALYMSGLAENSENGTVQFNPLGFFQFRESGVWLPLGGTGGAADTNTTYTGVYPIEIAGTGSPYDVSLLYDTDDFTLVTNYLTINHESLKPYDSKSITMESPLSGDNLSLFYTEYAVTVNSLHAVCYQSGYITYNVKHSTDRAAAGNSVLDAAGRVVSWAGTGNNYGNHVEYSHADFDDVTIPSGSWVWLDVTGNTSKDVVDEDLQFHLTIKYRRD